MTADIFASPAATVAYLLRVMRRALPIAIVEVITVDQLFGAAGAAYHEGYAMDGVCLDGVGVVALIVMLIGHASARLHE
jgi:hypothetical protein